MKIVVISTKDLMIDGVDVINDIRELNVDDYDCIVFNSSLGTDLDLIRCITSLRSKEKAVIYINEDVRSLYYCLFRGIDADIYNSEDFLTDYGTLEYLASNYKSTGMELKVPDDDLDVLTNGVMAIVKKEADEVLKLVSNELWLTTINNAVDNLSMEIHRSKQINGDVVEVLNSVTTLLDTVEESMRNTDREFAKLQNMMNEYEKKNRPNTPFMFSTYTVPVTVKKVFYIKVYGSCKYLLSFLGVYQHYLKMNKQYNSKLLVMLPKLKLHMQKYAQKQIPQLSRDSIGMVDLKAYNFFVTFEPKKSILDAFFKEGANMFIVVDMLQGDDMLEGYNVEKFNAVNGISDIETYNLPTEKLIISLISLKEGVSNIMIPHLIKYQEANEQTRRTLYFDRCEPAYRLLDRILIG